MKPFLPLIALAMLSTASFAADMPGAEQQFLMGNWQEAIDEYEAVINEEPSVENLNRLGDAFFYFGRYGAAMDAFERALSVRENPDSAIALAMLRAIRDRQWPDELISMAGAYGDNPRLWRSIGIVHMLAKNDGEAIRNFKSATERDAGDYMSYFYTGFIHESRHEYDDGISAYRKSVGINPYYAQALNNLGYCYKERHYYTFAIEMYGKAIEIQPLNAGLHYNIGNAYTHKNMLREAFDSYKRAVELDPAFAKAHYNLGRGYMKRGMLEEAAGEFKLYLKHWDPSISEHDAPHPETVEEMVDELKGLIAERDGRR
jgi:tetratricopeptide (TPR) repeat protein